MYFLYCALGFPGEHSKMDTSEKQLQEYRQRPELPQNGEVKTLGVCGKVCVATLVQCSAVRMNIAVCYHIYGYSEMQ